MGKIDTSWMTPEEASVFLNPYAGTREKFAHDLNESQRLLHKLIHKLHHGVMGFFVSLGLMIFLGLCLPVAMCFKLKHLLKR